MKKTKRKSKYIPSLLILAILVILLPVFVIFLRYQQSLLGRASSPTSLPNLFGQALSLSGDGYLNIDNSDSTSYNPKLGFTVEAWVKPATTGYMKVVNRSNGSQNSFMLDLVVNEDSLNPGGYTAVPIFSITNVGNNCLAHTIRSSVNFSSEDMFKWHHIAGVVQADGKMDIFFDGKRSTSNFNHIVGICSRQILAQVGARQFQDGTADGYLNGFIDEVRVSTVSRYPDNFTPALTPFVEDADTRTLYHFNGDFVDSSGLGFNGTPVGNYSFVPSGIVPSPTPSASPLPVPTITTTSLRNAKVNRPYNVSVKGRQLKEYVPLTMIINDLPPGLSYDPSSCKEVSSYLFGQLSCTISGAPTTVGEYSVEVTLSDSFGGTTTQVLPLKVSN